MLKKVLIGLAVLCVGFCGFVAMQPGTYSVTRSATVTAPADLLFPMVSDFRNWTHWSPWEAMDPTMKKTFEGTPGAAGSSYAWVGNGDVGEGKMTIVETKPNESLNIKLEFVKPFAAISPTFFTFASAGATTTVT